MLAFVPPTWLAQGLRTLAVPILSAQGLDRALVAVQEKASQQLGSVSLVETWAPPAKECRVHVRDGAALEAHPGPWENVSALGGRPGWGLGARMPGTESWPDF